MSATDAAVGLFTSLVLGVPLLIAFFTALAWDFWSWPAEPPRFHGYTVRQSWKVDPLALLDQELRRERLTVAIVSVHDRLLRELTGRHGLTSREILGGLRISAKRRDPTVDRACRAARALETTYQLASRAEDPLRADVWSEWRRPAWRASARRRFDREFSEVESVLPILESTP